MTDIPTWEPWLGQWQKVRPDIDPSKFAINGRLIRLLRSFERQREKLLESIGLTLETSDLLISLLRSGAPEGLSATELRSAATFPIDTSSAMTYRIDRAQSLGLVERRRSDTDRRGVIISLTERGRDLAQKDVELHMTLMDTLLADFSDTERATLSELLGRFLVACDEVS